MINTVLYLILHLACSCLFAREHNIYGDEDGNLSSNEIRHWCRRLSHFKRNLQETLHWHTPHAVQYSPKCMHRTPTQGARATYCTPKVPRPERWCSTYCCWRLRPIPFWKRLAVSNKTRLDNIRVSETNHPDRITWRPSWDCTHEINSPQSCLVAENRSGDWKGYPWMSTVQQNPQGSSSLTASSMVLADSSMVTCSRRFCHPPGKTLPHHGWRPL